MLERVWWKGDPCTLFLKYKLVQPLWKTLWRFVKNYNVIQKFLSWVYIPKNENTNLKRFMNPNVRGNIIYNSQDMEAT